jgi:hypothetical protein
VAQSPATKLINRAARERLKPLGLKQKGQSRLWLDDHGWWVLGVDFESFAYAQGSRLVVFADFMWHRRDHIAYAVGGRVGRKGTALDPDPRELRCRFEDDEAEFERCAAMLAERAAAEVATWRSEFPTLRAWADYLDRAAGTDFWRQYDAAMAARLTGDSDAARRWFARVLEDDDDRDWAVEARHEAQALRELVGDTDAFTARAAEHARLMRGHLGLQPEFDVGEGRG